MRASATLVAELGADGTTRLPVLRSQAPLILRQTPEAVYLVGGAAGPLGGDVLELRIDVREGATLRLRTSPRRWRCPAATAGSRCCPSR